MEHRGRIIISVSLSIVFIALVFYVYRSEQKSNVSDVEVGRAPQSKVEDTPPWSPPPPRVPQAGYKEYHNLTYRLSLFYPEDLVVNERKEPGTALTVTFVSERDDKQFQIYIQPYGLSYVTDTRFALDVPSGVMASSTDIMIDGAAGRLFYSRDAILDETVEVWFIKHGFLYEVTTYKALDGWITEIMQTWRSFPE